MKNRLKNINFYLTSIALSSGIDNIVTSGTFVIKDTTVNGFSLTDGNQLFYVIVDADLTLQREIFRITNVNLSTKTLTFDKRISPNGKEIHSENALVQINDFAESLNFLSLHTDDSLYPEIVSLLDVKILGGVVRYGPTSTTISDHTLTMAPNATNYIIIDFADGDLKSVTSLTGLSYYAIATVVTNGTDILSLTDDRALFVGFDPTYITPSISIGGTVTLNSGLPATVTNTGTSLAPIFNFGIPKGTAGAIAEAPEGEAQIISDNIVLPDGWTVSIIGSTIKILQPSGVYTIYSETDITTYGADGTVVSTELKTGTFTTPVITYTDGMIVNGVSGLISFEGIPAYKDKSNTFFDINTFNGDVIFNKGVSFPPAIMELVGNDIVFDGSKSRKAKITLTDTTAKTISFKNMTNWGNIEFAIVTVGSTVLSKGTVTGSGTVIGINTLQDPANPVDFLPLTMTGPDVFIFVGDVYETKVHLGVSLSR